MIRKVRVGRRYLVYKELSRLNIASYKRTPKFKIGTLIEVEEVGFWDKIIVRNCIKGSLNSCFFDEFIKKTKEYKGGAPGEPMNKRQIDEVIFDFSLLGESQKSVRFWDGLRAMNDKMIIQIIDSGADNLSVANALIGLPLKTKKNILKLIQIINTPNATKWINPNEISISDFSFKHLAYGNYKITYTSPNTGESWTLVTTDTSLISIVNNNTSPNRKQLEKLRRACKTTTIKNKQHETKT